MLLKISLSRAQNSSIRRLFAGCLLDASSVIALVRHPYLAASSAAFCGHDRRMAGGRPSRPITEVVGAAGMITIRRQLRGRQVLASPWARALVVEVVASITVKVTVSVFIVYCSIQPADASSCRRI